jgi:hypothetical protein
LLNYFFIESYNDFFIFFKILICHIINFSAYESPHALYHVLCALVW